jgi:hypothetical protein
LSPLLRPLLFALVLALVTTTLAPLQPIASAFSLPASRGVMQRDDNGNSNDNQRSATSKKSDRSGPTVPYIGVWTNGSPYDVPHLNDLGVGWARAVAVWSTVEPANGSFDWTDLDAQINASYGGGRRQVLVMVRNNPAWAATSRCKINTDAERQNLADFMTALVTRYKDRVSYWQLYNEMNNTSEAFDRQYDLGGCFGTASGATPTQSGRDSYARMLETVGAAIHDADANAQVVSGAVMSGNFFGPMCPTCLFDIDFAQGMLNTLKKRGSLDQLDVLAVHFYSSQHDGYDPYGPDLLGRVTKLRQDMRDAGLSERRVMPIMVDEGSYTGTIGRSTSDPNDAFNRAQQNYVVKALARAAAADVVYFWFWLTDIGGGGLGSDNAYGLLTTDGTPKPSYTTFRYFTSIVGNADTDKAVVPLDLKNAKLEGYEFRLPDGRRLQLVWNKVDSEQIAYKPADQVMSVSNPIGTQIPSAGGVVVVNDEPRYIFTRP